MATRGFQSGKSARSGRRVPVCIALGLGFTLFAVVSAGAAAAAPAADRVQAPPDAGTPIAAAAAPSLVNLNTASEQELEKLPGIGPGVAKKIIDARPLTAVSDLLRAGVPARTVELITPLVTVGTAIGSTPPALRGAAGPNTVRTPEKEKALGGLPPAPPKVDLNSATAKQLETLPGVGPDAAARIIALRPYSTVEDLTRAGLSATIIARLAPYATASRRSAPPPAGPAGAPSTAPSAPGEPSRHDIPAAAAAVTSAGAAAIAPPPCAAGMVWANPTSKIFHREGDRYYGKTKHGRCMTESDAKKSGYREAKTAPKPPQ